MLAAMNGHKDVVLILTQKGANLNVMNEVSVYVHMLYDKSCISEVKMLLLFSKSGTLCYTIIIKSEILSFKNIPNIINIVRRKGYNNCQTKLMLIIAVDL